MKAQLIHSLVCVCAATAPFIAGAQTAPSGRPGSPTSAEFTLEVQPAYLGAVTRQAVDPLIVDINNPGPAVRGDVQILSDVVFAYPVSLRAQGITRIFVYPRFSRFYGRTTRASVQAGRLSAGTDIYFENSPQNDSTRAGTDVPRIVALIGSLPAKSPLYATPRPNTSILLNDQWTEWRFALAGKVPTRPAGYRSVSVVILGKGSERISDQACEALKTWAATGGVIVFPEETTKDPRWAPLMPKPTILSSLSSQRCFGFGEIMSVRKEAWKAPQTRTPVTRAPAVFAGGPMGEAPGAKEAVTVRSEIESVAGGVRYNTWEPTVRPGRGVSYNGGDVGVPVRASAIGKQESADDPFAAKLLAPARLILILFGYFVLVVPINFLVLKKLGRGELAWITAPILSIACACIFFGSSSNLHRTKIVRATDGVLVVRSDNSQGLFVGRTDMFFPEGGVYDLKMTVDTIEPNRFSQGGTRAMPVFTDTGALNASRYFMHSREFGELGYTQLAPTRGVFQLARVVAGKNSYEVSVSNNSDYSITDGVFVATNCSKDLPAIGPHSLVKVKVSVGELAKRNWSNIGQNIDEHQMGVMGVLHGFIAGPQIGEPSPVRGDIGLALFADDEVTAQ